MRGLSCFILTFISYASLASPSRSDEMIPLLELIGKGADNTYPIVRCAALFYSVLLYAGETQMGPENTKKINDEVAAWVNLATEIRAPAMKENARPSVIKDISLLSDQYLSRYQSNYTSFGQAFGTDALWQSDTDVCVKLFGKK